MSLPVAELKGRAIRKRSGTPFLKKGVILVESPLERCCFVFVFLFFVVCFCGLGKVRRGYFFQKSF